MIKKEVVNQPDSAAAVRSSRRLAAFALHPRRRYPRHVRHTAVSSRRTFALTPVNVAHKKYVKVKLFHPAENNFIQSSHNVFGLQVLHRLLQAGNNFVACGLNKDRKSNVAQTLFTQIITNNYKI